MKDKTNNLLGRMSFVDAVNLSNQALKHCKERFIKINSTSGVIEKYVKTEEGQEVVLGQFECSYGYIEQELLQIEIKLKELRDSKWIASQITELENRQNSILAMKIILDTKSKDEK